jgi:predicted amidohydrolase YtcJ
MTEYENEISRRRFIKLSAAATAGLVLTACVGRRDRLLQPSQSQADLVLMNGKIITVDPRDTIVQAVAAKDGLILKTGTSEEITDFIGPRTNVIDLQGKTVTPGLVDSHIHVLPFGKQAWEGFTEIRYPYVRTKEELLQTVEEKAKTLPKGEWISGNQGFLLAYSDAPNRRELDVVAPNHPVYLRHMGGQYAVVNSLALELAGVDEFTPNPYGGKIVKDPDTGELTGLLNHYSAQNLVGRVATGWGPRSEKDRMGDIERGQELCLAAGYTSGQDVIVSSGTDVDAYKSVAKDRNLKMRMYLLQYVTSPQLAKEALKNAQRFKTGMLTFGGWKLAMDGGYSAGTALMYDRTLQGSKNSYPYYKQDVVNQMVTVMHKAGYQVSFHCTGDHAIDMAINAIEAALKEAPGENHRHRIEHLICPKPESLKRIKDLGILVSTQPQWISMLADGYNNVTNKETMDRFMPLKTMKEMGIPLAFGCDVPATPFVEPAWAFAGAVTRTTWMENTFNPDEKLTMQDALRIHTMGSAYASFEEDVKGSIEEGKVADMVVWSHDLYSLDPMTDLVDFKAESTIVAGQVVF